MNFSENKITLNIETHKIISVEDWDSLVQETYGRPYNFQQQDRCKERQQVYIEVPCEEPEDYENTSIHEEVNGEIMGVSFTTWLARDPKQELDGYDDKSSFYLTLFWERNFYPCIDMLVNDLNSKDLLPDGDYYIDID